MPKETAYCKCGKKVRLKLDGTPTKHTQWMNKNICNYSGKDIRGS